MGPDTIEPPDLVEDHEAKQVYLQKCQDLGVLMPLTHLEYEMIAGFAEADVNWRKYKQQTKDKGDTVPTQLGHPTTAPWRREENNWFAQRRAFLLKLEKRARSNKNKAPAFRKDSPYVELIRIDAAKVWDPAFTSVYVERANRYVDAVLGGKIPACLQLKAACERQRKDLARQRTVGFKYAFSDYLADQKCRFIESVPHVKGRWAKHKEMLKLEDWECFLVTTTFGWADPATSLRRFVEVYWEICRKNGKSILAAAIGLAMFCADDEHGAEVYSGATSEKQAWEVFRPARLMALQTPALCEAAGITVNAKALVREADGSRFEPMIGKPGDGASPSCSIHDEFHEHDTSDQVDTMETGMLAREQPLLMKITTAGYNLAGPCYEHRTKAHQVLTGALENERLFAVIYSIDLPDKANNVKGDDWADPKSLAKANPNYGVSVDSEYLLAKQRSAAINADEQNKFMTKHLNIWCSAKKAWLSLQLWNAAADVQLVRDELKGADCWSIFDLASKLDISANILLFSKRMNDMNHYYLFGRYYLPESALEDDSNKNAEAYRKWHRQGLLTITDGATTDFEKIRDDMVADAKVFNPREMVYDPFNATHMSQLLIAEGLTCVEFQQKPQNFAVPMDEVVAALKDSRLHHDGNPIMTWMISNVKTAPAKKGLFWPTKEKNEHKIDGPVCLIMGVGRAMGVSEQGSMDEFLESMVTA